MQRHEHNAKLTLLSRTVDTSGTPRRLDHVGNRCRKSQPRTPQRPCVSKCLCRNSWLQGRRNVIAPTPLPNSCHCDAATSVRLSGPLPQQSAARTPQRHSLRLPLPQQLARGTARRVEVERTEVPEHRSTRHDAQEERSITMYGTCRRDWKAMVGGGG